MPTDLIYGNPCDVYQRQLVLPRVLGPGPAAAGAVNPSAPSNRERFHAFNSIVTPAAGTTNSLVVSFQVPSGHNCEVIGLLNFYSGTGFIEGDATLLYFSLRLNGAGFVRDYAVIPNTLGSLSSGPWPVIGKLKLVAGDLLEYLVTVPVGSTIATGGTNRVHSHILGYYWPVTG
jgi:hypothetical protein